MVAAQGPMVLGARECEDGWVSRTVQEAWRGREQSIPERECEKGREEEPGIIGVCTRSPCPRSGV